MNGGKLRRRIELGDIFTIVLGALYLLTLVSIMVAPSSLVTLIIFIAFAVALLTFAVLLAIAGMRLESRYG